MPKAGFSDDVMAVLRQAAPTLAGAVTMAIPGVGPLLAPVMAGVAKQALGKAFGVEPTEEAINTKLEREIVTARSRGEDALLAETDLHLKLKQVQDVEYQKMLLETDLGHHKLNNEDTRNARETFANKTDYTQKIVGMLVLLGFFAMVGYSMKFAMPTENRDFFLLMAGQVSGAFITVVGFFYGSSQGSKRSGDAVRNELARRP